MNKRAKKHLINALYVCALIAVVFAAWAIGAAAVGDAFVLPSIPQTFSALGETLALRSFWTGLGGTLLRCVISYAISVALFFALFCLSVAFDGFRRFIDPLISALRTLPTVAVALILALVVGGYVAPVVLAVLVIMPILYSSARARVATVQTELIEVCRICGAGRRQVLAAVYLPTAAAGLPDALSSAFSYNVKAVIGAEILVQAAGSLGMLMNLAKVYLMTASLIAMTFFAVVMSVVFELALRAVLNAALAKYRE